MRTCVSPSRAGVRSVQSCVRASTCVWPTTVMAAAPALAASRGFAGALEALVARCPPPPQPAASAPLASRSAVATLTLDRPTGPSVRPRGLGAECARQRVVGGLVAAALDDLAPPASGEGLGRAVAAHVD